MTRCSGELYSHRMRPGRCTVTVRFHQGDSQRYAALSQACDLQEMRYEGNHVIARIEINAIDLERLRSLPGPMQVE